MSFWKGQLRSSSMADQDGKIDCNDGEFTLAVLEAFKQDCVVKKLQKIFQSSIAPLEETLRQLNETNAALRRQIADRDEKIQKLEDRVAELEVKNNDLEQQGRKGSIRIFGLPEHGEGPLEQKLLKLCNEHLKLQPPICAEDIEVAHRLGKPPPKPQLNENSANPADANAQAEAAPGDSSVPKKSLPGAVIVKLTSRKTKGRIMDERAKHKDNPFTLDGRSYPVYIGDDLTKRRATLAFRARQLRRHGFIQDTWIMNSKICAKDNRGRISQIYIEDDLKKLSPR